jgi:hypothetical protein
MQLIQGRDLSSLIHRDTQNEILVLENAISKQVVDYLRSIYTKYPWRIEQACVTNSQAESDPSPDLRQSKYIRITKDETEFKDIFHNMEKAMFEINEMNYNFDISGITEDIKIIGYGPGDFFNWHYDNMAYHVSTRKLNFSIQLSDSDEYEDGDLEFFLFDIKNRFPASRKIGTMICYPAYLPHRATRIKSGQRLALVGHVNGNAFR